MINRLKPETVASNPSIITTTNERKRSILFVFSPICSCQSALPSPTGGALALVAGRQGLQDVILQTSVTLDPLRRYRGDWAPSRHKL
jgi:hypothetical protein